MTESRQKDLENGIDTAMRALKEVAPRAQADTDRPAYHFAAPAEWMNDINGPIYHKGYYHIFYQHNPLGNRPYDDTVLDHVRWASMYWGHARSTDLVSWVHLPIALAPMKGTGEMSCWSGCATINGDGLPLIFYTAVFENELPYVVPFEQRAAIGDDDLVTWERSRHNPILSPGTHGGPDFNLDWRDPFIFHADGRTFMIIGACGDAGTPVFEARDEGLTGWRYRGIMWDKSVECPNFVQIGDKWVFISSPFDSVRYDVGSFDTDILRFTPESGSIVDYGHYYGTNTVFGDLGRCILLGWIPGWDWDAIKSDRSWNGCMALPRVLSLSSDDKLLQQPVPELQKLRMNDQHFRADDIMLNESSRVVSEVRGDMLEIIAEFSPGDAVAFGLRVRRSDDGRKAIPIAYDKKKHCIDAAGAQIPFPKMGKGETLKLHVFLDRSVVEVYVNDGTAVATRMIDADPNDLGLEVFGRGGRTELQSIDIWKLAPADIKGLS